MSTFYDEGNYLCEITSQGMTKAQTGTPQFVFKFRVLSFADGSAVVRQYERTCYRSITDKTMPYLKKDLEALGFEGTSLRQLDPNNGNFYDLTGVQSTMSCRYEEGQDGEIRERWNVVWATQGGSAIEGESVDAATFRKLDALFGASKKPQPQSQSQPQRVTARAAERDDNTEFDDESKPVTRRTAAVGAGPRGAVTDEITDEDIPF